MQIQIWLMIRKFLYTTTLLVSINLNTYSAQLHCKTLTSITKLLGRRCAQCNFKTKEWGEKWWSREHKATTQLLHSAHRLATGLGYIFTSQKHGSNGWHIPNLLYVARDTGHLPQIKHADLPIQDPSIHVGSMCCYMCTEGYKFWPFTLGDCCKDNLNHCLNSSFKRKPVQKSDN